MVINESLARALAFLPVIRDIFANAEPTTAARERVMTQLNARVHEHPKYRRLTLQAKSFLAGYIHKSMELAFDSDEESDR